MSDRLTELNEILSTLNQSLALLETAHQTMAAEEKHVRGYIPSHETELILTLLGHNQKENVYLREEIQKRIGTTNNLIAIEKILRKYGANHD